MTKNNTPLFDLDLFKYKVDYALEASAGTGKTYSITEIVKQLLVKYGLGLDKILIVTYTDKAAGELKNRIRDILTDSKNGTPIVEQLDGKVNCDIDNASIGTIHSFCKDIIKEFAISSDQVSSLDLADGDIITNYAKKYVREGKILNEITKFLKINKFVDEEDLVNMLVGITSKYYLDKDYKEVESIVSYLRVYDDEALNRIEFKLFECDDVAKTLEKESPVYYAHYKFLKEANKDNTNEFLKQFDDYISFLNSDVKASDFKVNIGLGYTHEEQNAFNALFKLREFFKKDFDIEMYLVDKYIVDFYKSYQEFKEENRLQSFNDMIRVIRELVVDDNSRLLECLRNKYSYAIIDEFQDTNQIQFDIFSKIFMCEDHNIIVVGDPKQSIYAFQGADVTVYQKAVDIISKRGEKCRLGKNYRSSHAVVEFGNALFPYYEFDNGFEPSDHVSKKDKKNKERRLIYKGKYVSGLWLNETPLSKDSYARFAVEQILDCTTYNESGHTNLQKEYIQNGKSTIEDVSFKDFVVLARTKYEMLSIQNALKFAGIPYIRYKDDSLFSGVECADWIAILEAIYIEDFTGKHRGFFRKALFTKFFNCSLNEISKEKYDSDDIEEIALFNKWRQLAACRLWQDLFDEIIIDSKIDEHMSSLTDLQSLAIYKQLANYSIDYLSKGNGLFELIRHLRSVSKFGNDEDEEEGSLIVAKSTEFNCVSIMTMHASKGLQFPVVISVGGSAGMREKNIPAFSYHIPLEDGTIKHYVCVVKIDGLYKEETISEFKRLFYVAYTRPEFLLIAPRYGRLNDKLSEISSLMENFINDYEGVMIDDDDMEIPYFELKEFNNTRYKTLKKITQEILKRNNQTVDEEQDLLNQKQVLLDLIYDKKEKVSYKHSYSSLAHPNREEDNEIIDDLLDIPKEGDNSIQNSVYDASSIQIDGSYDPSLSSLSIPDGYPKGASMGNAIHEVFEKVDFMNYENNLENLIIDIFKSNGFNLSNKPEWIEYTKDIVKSVLNASLPIVKGNAKSNDEFKLNQIPFKDRKSEIEFNFNYPNEALRKYLNGFIDLVFKRGDVYSILDWKSDTLNDNFTSYSDKDKLKAQVDERYSIQRVLYSYCLIKWLKQYYKKGEDEIFNNHFGGIYYVFVRGCNEDTLNGVYVQTWNSWSDLESEFLNILKSYKEE